MRLSAILRAAVIAFILAASLSTALAQTGGGSIQPPSTDIFEPGEKDLSLTLLYEILELSRGGESDEAGEGLFRSALRILNLATLAFGAAIFAYTALVGTLQSAHDGQLLGKQWSTVWVPARFLIGVTLLVPTASGLCMAQHGMLWMLGQGVGIASKTWETAVAARVGGNEVNYVTVRHATNLEVREAMTNIMLAELCVAVSNKYLSGEDEDPMFKFHTPSHLNLDGSVNKEGRFRSHNQEVSWGGATGSGQRRNVCGSITFQFDERWGGLSDARIQAFMAARENISEAVTLYVSQANASAPPPPLDGLFQVLDEQTSAYGRRVSSAVENATAEINKNLGDRFLEDATRNGWVTAGTWYFQMARITQELNRIAGSTPTYEPPIGFSDLDANDGMSLDEAHENMSRSWWGLGRPDPVTILVPIKATYDAARAHHLDQVRRSYSLMQEDSYVGGAVGQTGNAFQSLSNRLFGISDDASDEAARHFGVDPSSDAPAIIQMKNVGDHIVGAAAAVFIASTAATMTPMGRGLQKSMQGLTKAKGLSNLIGPAAGMVTFIAIAIFSFGVVLAFWLPMLPFIIWMGGVIGWFVSSLEMLVATPVWIAAHLHPDGDGVASRHAASGYMIVIELLLRPVLMVFGLIVAMAISDVLLNFIASQFYTAMASVLSAESTVGVVSWVMAIIIFTTLCWMAINFTFKAISSVPTGVMRWLGGMQGSNTEMAEGLGENARVVVAAGAHQMAGGIRSMQGRRNLRSL